MMHNSFEQTKMMGMDRLSGNILMITLGCVEMMYRKFH
jgi:hypothetical protein